MIMENISLLLNLFIIHITHTQIHIPSVLRTVMVILDVMPPLIIQNIFIHIIVAIQGDSGEFLGNICGDFFIIELFLS